MKRWWKQSHVKSSQTFRSRYHTMNLHLIRFRPYGFSLSLFSFSSLYIWIKWSILYNEIQANCVIYTIFVAVNVPQAVYRLWHIPLSDDEIRYLHYCDYFSFICLFRHHLLSCSCERIGAHTHTHTWHYYIFVCIAICHHMLKDKK